MTDWPDEGLVIGADDITVDLNDHTIDGDGELVTDCPPDQACDVGVDNGAGHSDLAVEDGAIRDYATGAIIVGADRASLRALDL